MSPEPERRKNPVFDFRRNRRFLLIRLFLTKSLRINCNQLKYKSIQATSVFLQEKSGLPSGDAEKCLFFAISNVALRHVFVRVFYNKYFIG